MDQFQFLEYTLSQLKAFRVPFTYVVDPMIIRPFFSGMGMKQAIINYLLVGMQDNSEITLRNINPRDFPQLNLVRGPAEYFLLKRGSKFVFFAISPASNPFVKIT